MITTLQLGGMGRRYKQAAANASLLTNGTLDGGGASWTIDGAGTFTGDKANFTSFADQKLAHTPAITLTNGVSYVVTWTISNWPTGAAYPQFHTGGGPPAVNGTLTNGNGVKTETIVANGNAHFRFIASSGGTDMSIDDVSVVPL